MIRLILAVTFITIFLLISIPILLVLFFIGLFAPKVKEKVSLAMVSWAFRCVLFFAGTKVTVRGEENIPKDEGVLFIGNHRSYFDIIITYGFAPVMMSFISKKQVRLIPILSLWMMNLHCLFLDRNDLKQGLEVINRAADLVRSGTSVVIYPEGTRNKTQDILQPFHRGSFKIAQKTGCKIIPVTMTHTDDIYEAHRPFVRAARVTLTYGEPVDTGAMDPKERKTVDARIKAIIEDTYRQDFDSVS